MLKEADEASSYEGSGSDVGSGSEAGDEGGHEKEDGEAEHDADGVDQGEPAGASRAEKSLKIVKPKMCSRALEAEMSAPLFFVKIPNSSS